jgi:urea transport system permease protein
MPESIVSSGLPAADRPRAASPLSTSTAAFRRSQTFLARLPDVAVFRLRLITVIAVAVLFFLVIPILNAAGIVPDYKLNVLGKYLSVAIVAVGIDLIWGYTGILSLCQAFFFCLGAYAMAMHLSLPEGGGVYRTPQFMEFAYYGHGGQLPPFWKPFASFTFALIVGILLPAIIAGIFGFFIFRSRVRGVYFSIVTQAVAWGTWLLISRNEMLLGGTNGLTNFYRPLTQSRPWILGLYLTTLVLLTFSYLLCRTITKSKLGRVLVAIRDKETRLYFAGYRPYAFKVFAFAVAAALAGIGGMLYAPQTGIVTPQNMNVEASIVMVIWVAMGGRGKLWGAIFGTLLVSYTYSAITSDLPTIWPFIQGGMALAVVLVFPDGVVGVWDQLEKQIKTRDLAGFLVAGGILFGIVLFVLCQALGLMPHFLETVVFSTSSLGDVRWKYLVLVGLLAAGIIRWLLVRKRPAPKPGFEVLVAAKGVA